MGAGLGVAAGGRTLPRRRPFDKLRTGCGHESAHWPVACGGLAPSHAPLTVSLCLGVLVVRSHAAADDLVTTLRIESPWNERGKEHAVTTREYGWAPKPEKK